jgi:hypothetical protein
MSFDVDDDENADWQPPACVARCSTGLPDRSTIASVCCRHQCCTLRSDLPRMWNNASVFDQTATMRSLAVRFFKPSMRGRSNRELWRNASDAYRSYLEVVRDAIPQAFLELPNPHDEPVRRVGWCGPRLVEVKAGSYTFIFTDGKLHNFDSNVVGDKWLYHEVHPAPGGRGELHVLLEQTELVISGTAVAVWHESKQAWIVGDPPSMVAPDR